MHDGHNTSFDSDGSETIYEPVSQPYEKPKISADSEL
jgi:hypothetical protein